MKWLVVMCCLAALLLGACVQKAKGPEEPVFAPNDAVIAAASVEDEGYVITVGDFVAVSSASRPTVDSVGRVQDDGTVPLNEVGYVRAAGSSITQFAETLGTLYKEVPGYEGGVADLVVEVKLGLYLVTGEVTSSGFRTYEEGLTLYDAMMSAGKLTGRALEDRVFLSRKGVDGREIIRYSKLEQLKELALKENDWIVVPHKVDFILH